MFLLAQVLRPVAAIYVAIFRYRLRKFGLDIKYKYLPQINNTAFVFAQADSFWRQYGFRGFSKVLATDLLKEHKYPKMLIGSCYLTQLKQRNFHNDFEKANFLIETTVNHNLHANLVDKSFINIGEYFHHGLPRTVFYGEMVMAKNIHTKLFGYFSLLQTKHKFIVTYACSDLQLKDTINDELFKVIKQLGVIKH
jgi:hypothetical protein